MTGPANHSQEIQELEDVEARLRAEDAATSGSTAPAPGTSAEAAAAGTSTDPNDRQAASPESPSVSDGGITQQSSAPATPATDSSVAGSIGDTSGAAPATDAGSSSTDTGAGSAAPQGAPASESGLPEGHPDHLGDVGDVGAIGAAGPQWEAAGLATEPSAESSAATSPFADVVTSLTQIRVDASKVDDARAPEVVNAITAAIDAANVAQ